MTLHMWLACLLLLYMSLTCPEGGSFILINYVQRVAWTKPLAYQINTITSLQDDQIQAEKSVVTGYQIAHIYNYYGSV